MSDIFISYASENVAMTEKLAYALEAKGWSVWWDRSIPVGTSFGQIIEEALDEAKCVVVIWSEDSIKSQWVRAEAEEARKQEKLLPLDIDGSKPPLVFRNLQTADFNGWMGDATEPVFVQLADDIRRQLDAIDSTDVGQIKPPEEEENSGNVSKDRDKGGRDKLSPSKPVKPKWIAPVAVVLLLSLLIGTVVLLSNRKGDAPQKNGSGEPEEFQSGSNISGQKEESYPELISAIQAPGMDLSDVLEPGMVAIPAGCFLMGSPESELGRDTDEHQHQVCVDAFRIGKYEVSFAEYDQYCVATACSEPDDEGWGRGSRPVINVSWGEAIAYTKWLAKRTGKHYRLPTEAEWEYAARGLQEHETQYPWGDNTGSNKANCDGCGSQWDGQKTAPVGSFAANDFGLYDTAGNVSEWTCSRYEQDYDGSEKECITKGNSLKVVRSGSWGNVPGLVRSANRFKVYPVGLANGLGFRLALD